MTGQYSMKKKINLVWLKRDIRTLDHQPLADACQSTLPFFVFYLFEPNLISCRYTSQRHLGFIGQSLQDLTRHIPNNSLHIGQQNIIEFLLKVSQQYTINTLFCHQETGLSWSYQRDLAVVAFCQSHHINLTAYANGAVVRGLKTRSLWKNKRQNELQQPIITAKFNRANWFNVNQLNLATFTPPNSWLDNESFQAGGETKALHCLEDFLNNRAACYVSSISSPELSQTFCSRLSAHLAYGNISIKYCFQKAKASNFTLLNNNRNAFISRLKWRCHFIQKLETSPEIEFVPINPAYRDFIYTKGPLGRYRLRAWQRGMTGFPFVDACMRMLNQTGYLNFRMRAMLVSFLCHYLDLDWRWGLRHLAKVFLDFEPGIHISQFQMQAGVTGINTLRIYNPIKQGLEQDPEALFIQKWVPELASLPATCRHQPWQTKPMENIFYQFELGKTYPQPIVCPDTRYRLARDKHWHFKNLSSVKQHKPHIIKQHVAR